VHGAVGVLGTSICGSVGVALSLMSESDSVRRRYLLEPSGPIGRIGAPHRLAALRGILAGDLQDARVATYIETSPGSRIAVMWPGEYRARLDPFEILNERGEVVATERESVRLTGGHLPKNDPRLGGRRRVFFASRATVLNGTHTECRE
jgi:hypothetical protein